MQNDFLAREILPKCFTSDLSEISMEAEAKENFSENTDLCAYTFLLYLIIRKYSTEKAKFSLPKKKKSRKPR